MDVLTLTLNPCVDRTFWPDGRTDMQSGGKGVNVARVLSNLGIDCIAAAPSGGETGDLFCRLARAEGVKLYEMPIAGDTRIIDTFVRDTAYTQQVIRHTPPDMSREEASALYAAVEKLLLQGRPRVFGVCGSACCEEAARTGARLIGRARDLGIATLLDASGFMLTEGAAACPDLIKPNQKELGELAGYDIIPGDEEQAARALLKKGIGQALVSLGEKGAMLVTGSQTLYCPAPRVDTVNPVGSGDSFTAGYLYALLKGQSEYGALSWACAAGAANAAMFPAARITANDIEKITGYAL